MACLCIYFMPKFWKRAFIWGAQHWKCALKSGLGSELRVWFIASHFKISHNRFQGLKMTKCANTSHVCLRLSTIPGNKRSVSWPLPIYFVLLSSACSSRALLWSDGVCPFSNPGIIAIDQSLKGLQNWVNECVWLVTWPFIPCEDCGHTLWPQLEGKSPKALQQLGVHMSWTTVWTSTRIMKKQHPGNAGVELEP